MLHLEDLVQHGVQCAMDVPLPPEGGVPVRV